jgi:uncharacterized protein
VQIGSFAHSTVLITGASAGLGSEFARQLAPAAGEIILVARRGDRLEGLEKELKTANPGLQVVRRSLDLRDHAALEAFCDWLDESGFTIDLLVNNAGLGDHGPFSASDWEHVDSMLNVNVYALTYLTFRILPQMKNRGRGAILNVSSVACLLPLPNNAVYAATKAYVTSLSEAIRAELRADNISVTALCPGPVHTEFLDHATRGSERPSHTAPDFFMVPAEEVVHQALEAIANDRARVIPGLIVNLLMTLIAFVPMFIKRLIYSVQAKRRSSHPSPGSSHYAHGPVG